jgi:CheY-like chemotaxis protein
VSTVLVVDDSLTDRETIQNVLANLDEFSVRFADSGETALEELKNRPPDVILIDPKMGYETGRSVVEEMRGEHPDVPAIVVTSYGDEEYAIRALQRGASSYVPKGMLDQELVGTLRAVMEVTQKRDCQARMLDRMKALQCQFVLENDRDLIAPLVGFFQEQVARLGICHEPHTTRLGIALDEALVNSLYHGNLEVSSELREQDNYAYQRLANQRAGEKPYCDRRIYVDADMSADQVEFTILDEGPGFDHRSLPDPTDPLNLDKVSGRGVLLMRTFMDEVAFNEAGNQVTLTKRGGSASD